jgi:hypothetical protein
MDVREDLPFAGTASDQVAEILATGGGDITTLFVSMSTRHPEGEDAAYLRWHALDHRPEQYRLSALRSSLRIVSTPECRAARAAADPAFEAVDHVMTYFFEDMAGLEPFNALAVALRDAGRMPYLLPAVQRGVYTVQDRAADPEAKAGADVLPWWPAKGIYLLVEMGGAPAKDLVDIPGGAGQWTAGAAASDFSTAEAGQQISYLFLDGDPVEVGERLRPVLKQRWEASGARPLLAAPFYIPVPYEWTRRLP